MWEFGALQLWEEEQHQVCHVPLESSKCLLLALKTHIVLFSLTINKTISNEWFRSTIKKKIVVNFLTTMNHPHGLWLVCPSQTTREDIWPFWLVPTFWTRVNFPNLKSQNKVDLSNYMFELYSWWILHLASLAGNHVPLIIIAHMHC